MNDYRILVVDDEEGETWRCGNIYQSGVDSGRGK